MKTVFKKTTWTSAGMLLALTCGTPAIADDTELLLINPDQAQQIPALFLADTSRPAVLSPVTPGQSIPDPLTCASDQLHVIRCQPDFLGQLPEHGIPRVLPGFDSTLRELPAIATGASAPE